MSALDTVAPAVRGFALRLGFEPAAHHRQRHAGLRRARLALAPAVAPAESTCWLTGLLRGSGLLLLHHDALWRAIDDWQQGLDHDVFMERLPLLRRAFSGFSPAERRQMGDKVKRLDGPAPQVAAALHLDPDRAGRVLPILAAILGGP